MEDIIYLLKQCIDPTGNFVSFHINFTSAKKVLNFTRITRSYPVKS